MATSVVNDVGALVVAHASLRDLLKKTQTPLQTAPSSREFPPSSERDLLTFIAAVCCLHSDCDEAAVAVARGAPTSANATFYVATIHDQISTALQSDFNRFLCDLRAAYNRTSGVDGRTCGEQIFAAMYRFAYPVLRQSLWNDDRLQHTSSYFGNNPCPPVQQALESLGNITKECVLAATDDDDVFQGIHEACSIIHEFVCEEHIRSSPVKSFLTDVISVCTVASYFHAVISGALLSDKDVESLTKNTPECQWEIFWIPGLPPPSAPFKVEVSTCNVATWLEEYSQCSSILPWKTTTADIASTCPEPLTKTGSIYTCAKPPAFHSEIVLLLWLTRHDIAVDKHIGCSGFVCYPCSKLVQALGKVYPNYDVVLSDMFDSTTIELPWALPPDVPKVVVNKLGEIILEDFRSDTLTYISRNGLYQNAFGPEVPEFPE